MKIINDQIEIEAVDIDALSPQLQADITFRAGIMPPHEYLSARFNAVLEESTHVHEKALLETHEVTNVAFARADTTTQEQVKTVLGVQFLPEALLTARAA